MPLELKILGPTELSTQSGAAMSVLRQPKRLALLAYLALASANGYRRRDQIVALLWPELDQLHARTQLRKGLHALRSAFGQEALRTRGEEELRLDPAVAWCDAVAFRDHVKSGRWSEALALYRGDLLEGLFPGGVGEEFERWLHAERSTIRSDAARSAWECSSRADLAGDRANAIAFARRATELDPDDEQSIRRLIAALDRYGDRAGALRVFQQWGQRLQAEFGAHPAPETRKLARKVQAPRKGESVETPTLLRSPGSPTASQSTSRVADVAARDALDSRSPARLPASPGALTRPILSFRVIVFAGIVLFAFAAGYAARHLSASRVAAGSVAVLPFNGLGDPLAAAVGEGIAEELTTLLTQDTTLTVRAVARSREAVTRGRDAAWIGGDLGVRHIVDGAVARDASRFRVTARLVRARDGIVLWGSTVDLDASAAGAAPERVAQAVAAHIVDRLRVH